MEKLMSLHEVTLFNGQSWKFALVFALLVIIREAWLRLWSMAASLECIFRAPSLILSRYKEANGNPFRVGTSRAGYICVSSPEHIEELSQAPHQNLSLHAVAKDLMQPKYTMCGFEWKDQRGVEGTGFVRALRSIMTARLPLLLPSLKTTLEVEMSSHLQSSTTQGQFTMKAFPTVKRLIAKTNSRMFFDEDLLSCDEFIDAAIAFPTDVVIDAEILKFLPRPLAKLASAIVTQNHRTSHIMHRYLSPIIEQRLKDRGREGLRKPTDCMQYLIDTSPSVRPWTVDRMVGEIMAIWFASVHSLAMAAANAILDLGAHPEYQETLRREQREMGDSLDVLDPTKLPLLDSFLKESSRVSSTDSISMRRKALKPLHMFGGLDIRQGEWVCVPQQALMYDPSLYQAPTHFRGTRFVPEDGQSKRSLFTDSNHQWLIWGYGSTACPGRFYASAVLRLLVGSIVGRYECGLPAAKEARSWTWRSAIIPRSSATVVFRELAVEGDS